MKKLFAIFTILLCSQLLYSQNILDEKNGFKTIKLNQHKMSFSNLSYFSKEDSYNIYKYNPDDKDLFNVFNTNMDQIFLYFEAKTDLLQKIEIVKTFIIETDLYDANATINFAKTIINNYVSQIGAYDDVLTVDKREYSSVGVKWIGKKVSLTVKTISFPLTRPTCKEEVRIMYEMNNFSTGF